MNRKIEGFLQDLSNFNQNLVKNLISKMPKKYHNIGCQVDLPWLENLFTYNNAEVTIDDSPNQFRIDNSVQTEERRLRPRKRSIGVQINMSQQDTFQKNVEKDKQVHRFAKIRDRIGLVSTIIGNRPPERKKDNEKTDLQQLKNACNVDMNAYHLRLKGGHYCSPDCYCQYKQQCRGYSPTTRICGQPIAADYTYVCEPTTTTLYIPTTPLQVCHPCNCTTHCHHGTKPNFKRTVSDLNTEEFCKRKCGEFLAEKSYKHVSARSKSKDERRARSYTVEVTPHVSPERERERKEARDKLKRSLKDEDLQRQMCDESTVKLEKMFQAKHDQEADDCRKRCKRNKQPFIDTDEDFDDLYPTSKYSKETIKNLKKMQITEYKSSAWKEESSDDDEKLQKYKKYVNGYETEEKRRRQRESEESLERNKDHRCNDKKLLTKGKTLKNESGDGIDNGSTLRSSKTYTKVSNELAYKPTSPQAGTAGLYDAKIWRNDCKDSREPKTVKRESRADKRTRDYVHGRDAQVCEDVSVERRCNDLKELYVDRATFGKNNTRADNARDYKDSRDRKVARKDSRDSFSVKDDCIDLERKDYEESRHRRARDQRQLYDDKDSCDCNELRDHRQDLRDLREYKENNSPKETYVDREARNAHDARRELRDCKDVVKKSRDYADSRSAREQKEINAELCGNEQYARKPYIARDDYDAKESYDIRETRAAKPTYDTKDCRDAKQSYGVRDPCDAKETYGVRDARNAKQFYDSRDQRDTKASYDTKDCRDAKQSYGIRDARDDKEFYDARDKRAAKPTYDTKDCRDAKDSYGIRNARDTKQPYDARDDRAAKATYDRRDCRDDKQSYGVRDNRDAKESYGLRDPRTARAAYDARDNRDECYYKKDDRDGQREHFKTKDSRGDIYYDAKYIVPPLELGDDSSQGPASVRPNIQIEDDLSATDTAVTGVGNRNVRHDQCSETVGPNRVIDGEAGGKSHHHDDIEYTRERINQRMKDANRYIKENQNKINERCNEKCLCPEDAKQYQENLAVLKKMQLINSPNQKTERDDENKRRGYEELKAREKKQLENQYKDEIRKLFNERQGQASATEQRLDNIQEINENQHLSADSRTTNESNYSRLRCSPSPNCRCPEDILTLCPKRTLNKTFAVTDDDETLATDSVRQRVDYIKQRVDIQHVDKQRMDQQRVDERLQQQAHERCTPECICTGDIKKHQQSEETNTKLDYNKIKLTEKIVPNPERCTVECPCPDAILQNMPAIKSNYLTEQKSGAISPFDAETRKQNAADRAAADAIKQRYFFDCTAAAQQKIKITPIQNKLFEKPIDARRATLDREFAKNNDAMKAATDRSSITRSSINCNDERNETTYATISSTTKGTLIDSQATQLITSTPRQPIDARNFRRDLLAESAPQRDAAEECRCHEMPNHLTTYPSAKATAADYSSNLRPKALNLNEPYFSMTRFDCKDILDGRKFSTDFNHEEQQTVAHATSVTLPAYSSAAFETSRDVFETSPSHHCTTDNCCCGLPNNESFLTARSNYNTTSRDPCAQERSFKTARDFLPSAEQQDNLSYHQSLPTYENAYTNTHSHRDAPTSLPSYADVIDTNRLQYPGDFHARNYISSSDMADFSTSRTNERSSLANIPIQDMFKPEPRFAVERAMQQHGASWNRRKLRQLEVDPTKQEAIYTDESGNEIRFRGENSVREAVNDLLPCYLPMSANQIANYVPQFREQPCTCTTRRPSTLTPYLLKARYIKDDDSITPRSQLLASTAPSSSYYTNGVMQQTPRHAIETDTTIPTTSEVTVKPTDSTTPASPQQLSDLTSAMPSQQSQYNPYLTQLRQSAQLRDSEQQFSQPAIEDSSDLDKTISYSEPGAVMHRTLPMYMPETRQLFQDTRNLRYIPSSRMRFREEIIESGQVNRIDEQQQQQQLHYNIKLNEEQQFQNDNQKYAVQKQEQLEGILTCDAESINNAAQMFRSCGPISSDIDNTIHKYIERNLTNNNINADDDHDGAVNDATTIYAKLNDVTNNIKNNDDKFNATPRLPKFSGCPCMLEMYNKFLDMVEDAKTNSNRQKYAINCDNYN